MRSVLATPVHRRDRVAAGAQSTSDIGGLRFIGAITLPNDTMVDGTLVGGLSGIDYDPAADLWY